MKNIKLIVFAFLAMSMATSCIVDDDPDTGYKDGSYFVGFDEKIVAVSYFVDEGVVLKQYPVKLMGGADGSLSDRDIVVEYSIDPSSTAVEGEEFDFVSNTGTLTIPAGSSFANFPLNINTGGLNPSSATTLILKLTGTTTSGTVVSSLNDTLKITFVGCIAEIDQYTYTVTVLRDGAPAGTVLTGEPIYKDGVNSFRTRTTAIFAPGTGGSDPAKGGVSFSVLCGEINLPTQGLLQNFFSNQVTDNGTGSVNEDGSFTLKFSVSGQGDFEQTFTRE